LNNFLVFSASDKKNFKKTGGEILLVQPFFVFLHLIKQNYVVLNKRLLMNKTFTSCLFLLLAFLLTVLPAGAQNQQTPVNSTDREKIDAIVVELLQYWDTKALLNVADVLSQMDNYDTSALSKDVLLRMNGLKTVIDGTPDYRLLFGGDIFTGHFNVVDGKWVKVSMPRTCSSPSPARKERRVCSL
jgi:hypothetical protein